MLKAFWETLINLFKTFFMPKESLEEIEQANKITVIYYLIEDNLAKGRLYFKEFNVGVTSGPYGSGYMAKGAYRGYRVKEETRSGFSQFGIGWQMSLRHVDTGVERGYAIHPDGNAKGSCGCQAINFIDKLENISFKNALENYLVVHPHIEVEIS